MLQVFRPLVGSCWRGSPHSYQCLLQDLPTSTRVGLQLQSLGVAAAGAGPPHGLMRSSRLTLLHCLLQDSAMDIFQVQSKLDVEHKLPVTGARNGTYVHRWGCSGRAAAQAIWVQYCSSRHHSIAATLLDFCVRSGCTALCCSRCLMATWAGDELCLLALLHVMWLQHMCATLAASTADQPLLTS